MALTLFHICSFKWAKWSFFRRIALFFLLEMSAIMSGAHLQRARARELEKWQERAGAPTFQMSESASATHFHERTKALSSWHSNEIARQFRTTCLQIFLLMAEKCQGKQIQMLTVLQFARENTLAQGKTQIFLERRFY